jgi:hypothetical protein
VVAHQENLLAPKVMAAAVVMSAGQIIVMVCQKKALGIASSAVLNAGSSFFK